MTWLVLTAVAGAALLALMCFQRLLLGPAAAAHRPSQSLTGLTGAGAGVPATSSAQQARAA